MSLQASDLDRFDAAAFQREMWQRMALEMDRDIFFGPFGHRAAYLERGFRWITWPERWRRLRCLWRGHRWEVVRSEADHPRPHVQVRCERCRSVAAQFNDPAEPPRTAPRETPYARTDSRPSARR